MQEMNVSSEPNPRALMGPFFLGDVYPTLTGTWVVRFAAGVLPENSVRIGKDEQSVLFLSPSYPPKRLVRTAIGGIEDGDYS